MNRRRLLAGLALSTGLLTTAGVVGGAQWVRPRAQRWPPLGGGRRTTPAGARRVAVVGGGLAGIAASAALAERGYAVELFEQSDALGGKLAGWPIEVGGETYAMEHGFHGFFRQYYNLRDLLAAAGADRDLVPQPSYTVQCKGYDPEPFGQTVLPFPLDLVDVVARSPGISLADVAGDRPGMRALLAYDPVKTFAEWDGVDMETFIGISGLEGPFAQLVLRPFGRASMNGLSRFSAAEAIRYFHFYMLGNPEGLGFEALGRGSHLSVLEPLTSYLQSLGVTLHLNTPVRRLAFEGGRAVGVVVGGAAPVSETRVAVATVPEQGWVAAGAVGFVRRTATGFEARSSRCTHMGCPVALMAQGGFGCPCHAGRYDDTGRNVAGPPPRPLQPLGVERRGDDLVVLGIPEVAEALVPADAVVVAAEVRGLQALAKASSLPDHAPQLARSIAAMGEAEPYSVARFWFDRALDADHPAFTTVSGYRWTDGLATYSGFQEGAQRWAAKTGGSVIETHAYAIGPERQGELAAYRDGLLGELPLFYPELRGAGVVHEEVMAQSNFTRFGPGDDTRRPTVHTEIDNLVLAGDHVKLPFPAFLMEAAVASGRLAANHILAADDVQEVPLPTVALRGPLASM